MRLVNKLGPLKVLNQHLTVYPTPMNLSYAYNFGSLAGVVLASQIITGILLAMHYVGHVDLAFNSVVHLMNDVPSGMILRYAHANGASLFFIVVYIHILRGVYYSSGNQPREAVWITGVVILLVMVLTAFIGYIISLKWISNDAIILLRDVQLSKTLIKNLEVYISLFDSFYVIPNNQLCYSYYPSKMDSMNSLFFTEKEIGYGAFITLTTKNFNQINFAPVKSYYNLHLVETQLKVRQENKHKAGVYIVVNNINGNFYVGSAITNRINLRFRNHCVHLNSSNKPLYRAINKYGIQNFSFHIIEYFNGIIHKENLKPNHLKLLERESFFISSFQPIYNILPITSSSLGYKHTPSSCQKIIDNYSLIRNFAMGHLNWGKNLSVGTRMSEKAQARYFDSNNKEQYLLKNKDNLFQGKSIVLYNINGDVLSEYNSIQQASKVFSCDRKTIRKYIQTGKLFKNLGYFNYKSLPNS